MILTENRCPLFGIMRLAPEHRDTDEHRVEHVAERKIDEHAEHNGNGSLDGWLLNNWFGRR
jgi:hypothetical protein